MTVFMAKDFILLILYRYFRMCLTGHKENRKEEREGIII